MARGTQHGHSALVVSFHTLGQDLVYKMHSKFYHLQREQFDAIHYAGMAFCKICIFTFFVVPYLALRIMT